MINLHKYSRLTYTKVFWAVSILSIILAVGDRFALSWTNGDYIMQRDSRNIIPNTGKVGWAITDWFWVISARTMIVSLNISFVTVMWMLPNFLEEAAPRWLDMDVRHSNLVIHKFAGIWLNGVVTVIHVLLLFLPTFLDNTPKQLVYDGFDFSNWWDPCVRTFSSFISDDLVVYTWDELFRIVLAILVFCIMMPISRADWMLYKSYSLAMGIHALAGFLFMIDMVRKNSHPLCWRFNLPFIFLYVIDRLMAMFWYRVHKFTVHEIRQCSESSFILFGRLENVPRTGQGCGDNYWLLHRFSSRAPCTPIFQRAHPYTAFQNWDAKTDDIWNVGFVINVNLKNKQSWSAWLMKMEAPQSLVESVREEQQKYKRIGPLAYLRLKINRFLKRNSVADGVADPAFVHDSDVATESVTKTGKGKQKDVVFKADEETSNAVEFDIRSYGPYRSSFYVVDSFDSYGDIVLIAGGSGFGFILSAITMLSENRRLQDPNDSSGRFKKTTIIYSARQIGVISIFAELLSKIPDFRNCYYHMRFTGRDTDANNQPLCYNLQNISSLKNFDAGKTSFGHGRFELHKFMEGFTQESKSGLVCACGSPSLLKNVKTECDKFELRLRVEEI